MANVRIELEQERVRWFYHVVAKNGNILETSQKYFSRSNAKRAARAAAWALGAKLIVRTKR